MSDGLICPMPSKTEKSSMRGSIGRRKRRESFTRYIFRVLKTVYQGGINRKAMTIMDNFAYDIFDRIVTEASRLCQYNRKPTLGSRDIQGAVKLILPGDLGQHAIAQATTAMQSYKRK